MAQPNIALRRLVIDALPPGSLHDVTSHDLYLQALNDTLVNDGGSESRLARHAPRNGKRSIPLTFTADGRLVIEHQLGAK